MKRSIPPLMALFAMMTFSCQPSVDIEKEKAAIIAAIEDETNAYWDMDIDRFKAVHILDETNTRLTASRTGYNFTEGWDEDATMEAFNSLKEYLQENPDETLPTEKKSNFRIKVYPNAAFAIYDNEGFDANGELTEKSIHSQFLEKIDGQWKTSFLSIVYSGSYDIANDHMRIANLYHQFNVEDMDDILTEDFIGRGENGMTWNRESHKESWRNNNGALKDTISVQLVQGNWAAAKIQRYGKYQGNDIAMDMIQIKRFEDGKIAEIFELWDNSQIPQ